LIVPPYKPVETNGYELKFYLFIKKKEREKTEKGNKKDDEKDDEKD
jgi:hypothetical protein